MSLLKRFNYVLGIFVRIRIAIKIFQRRFAQKLKCIQLSVKAKCELIYVPLMCMYSSTMKARYTVNI